MLYILRYFIKRIPREGFKSLSVPALAFTMVFLINVLGGIRERMAAEYAYVMDHHPIHIVVSDGDGIAQDGLEIGERYIDQFTDPEALWSLYEYVDNVRLRRTLDILEESSSHESALLIGISDWILTNDGMITFFMPEREDGGIKRGTVDFFYEDMSVDMLNLYREGGWTSYVFLSEDIADALGDGGLNISIAIPRGPNIRMIEIQEDWVQPTGKISGAGSNFILMDHDFIALLVRISTPFTSEILTPSYDIVIDGKVYQYSWHNISVKMTLPTDAQLIGISTIQSEEIFTENGAAIRFYDGYDEGVFASDEYICVVSEDMLGRVADGILSMTVRSRTGLMQPVGTELKVVGTVAGTDESVVYAPFKVVNALGSESDSHPPYTEILRATLADNRELILFKDTAIRSFSRVGVFFNVRHHAMTIFDAEFYDKTEALMQTIFFIEITTPFVYVISVCLGFVASFLLTRRRKAEFANMRSVGVNKRVIFAGALFEQFALCIVGVATGCALYSAVWGDISYEQSAVFLLCYTLGAAFSAMRAAGTDVLKILREKE
jgi:hypothetical protein